VVFFLFENIQLKRSDGTKTNERQIMEMAIFSTIYLLVSYYLMVIVWHKFTQYLTLNSLLFFSPFIMLLRLKTFGDKDLQTGKGGYDPVFFWVISLLTGLMGLGVGVFISLCFNKSYSSDQDLYFMVACSLIAQTITLMPDYYGKLVSTDLRTPTGQNLIYSVLKRIIILMVVSMAIVKFFIR
jgi:hypothetical protein